MCAKRTEPKLGCFANMFSDKFRSSRWRKASLVKRHIKNLLLSIEVQRRRREAMARQSQSDIAHLISNGRFSETVVKAKQFLADERKISAYDQVECFCKYILENFPPKDQTDVHLLPEGTKRAMAGIIFAASRLGELRDLQEIRSLFELRFGPEFDRACVDLRPGNLVDTEIVKTLDLPRDVISREIVIGISKMYQTKDTTSVESSEESAKEKSKFVHSKLGETEGRDRSAFMR